MVLLLGWTVTATLAADIPGYPDHIEAFDSREIAMLPNWCIYTQNYRDRVPGGNNRVEIDRWYAVMGPTFHAMHHYCNGLMKTNRAIRLARTQQMKRFYLESSITEFDYVLDRAPEDFVLLPEILTKKGENLIRLGKGALGVIELEHATKLKADYWPPYAVMSDYYKSIGDRAAAREALQRGIAVAPDAKSLSSRLKELGEAPDRKPKQKQGVSALSTDAR